MLLGFRGPAAMAGASAGLPAGVRLSDHISLGVIARAFPPNQVRRVLSETGRASKRERDLPAQVIPTRVKADSFRGFQTGASQILWRRTGGSPCGQELHFARTMTRPSFGP